MNEANNDAPTIRSDMAELAEVLLHYYNVTQPPVPVEQMLREPPVGLPQVDPTQTSFVMEHGLYCHEPRLAMARLLYREIAQNEATQESLGINISTTSYDDAKFFARCLLIPTQWVRALAEQGFTVDQISACLQAPSYAVIARLAELKLITPDTQPDNRP